MITGQNAEPATLPDEPLLERRHIGVVVAAESVDIPSRIDGILSELLVGIGDRVERDAPIARIDDRPMREQLSIALANERAASAQAKRATISMKAAADKFKRQEGLGDSILSQEDLEASRTRAKETAAARAEANAVALAEKTRVEQLRRMLRETTIEAPFAGRISLRYVGPGESVSRGAPIVRLIASGELRVDFVIPLEDRAQYRIGERILVALGDADKPLAEHSALISHISPDVDSISQMLTGQAALTLTAEQRAVVRAGMNAWVRPAQTAGRLD